jgi:DNA invertase Pin-like site-specific DNA recombinase
MGDHAFDADHGVQEAAGLRDTADLASCFRIVDLLHLVAYTEAMKADLRRRRDDPSAAECVAFRSPPTTSGGADSSSPPTDADSEGRNIVVSHERAISRSSNNCRSLRYFLCSLPSVQRNSPPAISDPRGGQSWAAGRGSGLLFDSNSHGGSRQSRLAAASHSDRCTVSSWPAIANRSPVGRSALSRSGEYARPASHIGNEQDGSETEREQTVRDLSGVSANDLELPDGLLDGDPPAPSFKIVGPSGFQSFGAEVDRIYKAIKRGVIAYSRVSSPSQERNAGSRGSQRDQLLVLEPYGVDISSIEVVECVESAATPNGIRDGFEYVLNQVRHGKVGVVVVILADRIARNDQDARRLYDALAAARGLVLITGQFYNPADPSQRFILNIHAITAEFENKQRLLRMMMSSCALARRLRYPVALPTGLVWACREDEAYRRAMDAEGLSDFSSESALALHREYWENKRTGARHYVLPDPAPGVYQSVQLRLRWLTETRKLSQVIDHIEAGNDGWPVKGHIPVRRSRVFDPDRPPEWVPLRALRTDGRLDVAHRALRAWYLTHALYGVYRFAPAALQRAPEVLHVLGTLVETSNAFPALFSGVNRSAVKEILAGTGRRPYSKLYSNPRDHRLATLRCGAPLSDGSICGLRLAGYPFVRAGRTAHRYHSAGCHSRGHGVTVPPDIEDATVDLVRRAMSEEVLAQAIAQVRTQDGANASLRKRRVTEIADLRDHIRRAIIRVEACGARGDDEGVEMWENRRFEHTVALKHKLRDLQTLEADASDTARLTGEDECGIRSLASSLDELLALAAPIPGKRREILAEFYRCAHVWQLGTGVFEVVVEFPSGVRIETVVLCGTLVKCRQPAMAMAYAALARWVDRSERRNDPSGATSAATELAALWKRLCPRTDDRAQWTTRRVWGAALLYYYRNALPQSIRKAVDRWSVPYGRPAENGLTMTAQEIATRTGESLESVLKAALSGKLGDATFTQPDDATSSDVNRKDLSPLASLGQVSFVVSLRSLHLAFEDHARREVIAATGWGSDDTIRIRHVVRELGVQRCWIMDWAQRHGVLVSDHAGRLYTRRSVWPDQPPRSLEAALAVGPPEARRLDPAYWVNSGRTNTQLPGISYRRLVRHATFVLRVGAGRAGDRSVYYWVGPEVREGLRMKTLAEAVADLGRSDVSVDDFMPEKHLARFLGATLGKGWSHTNLKRVLEGRREIIRLLAAPKTPWQSVRAYIYFPRALRESREPELVKQWLGGTRRTVVQSAPVS